MHDEMYVNSMHVVSCVILFLSMSLGLDCVLVLLNNENGLVTECHVVRI